MKREALKELVRWFFLEASAPLFGANLAFLAAGAFKYVAIADKTKFSWAWREAFDPFGWLYGGAFLAVQSGVKGYNDSDTWAAHTALVLLSFAGAVGCVLLLFAALQERGSDSHWRPPRSMLTATSSLMALILVASTMLQYDMNSEGVQNGNHQTESTKGSKASSAE